MTTIWILPSRSDPESEAIARLLDAAGEQTAGAWDDPRVERIRAQGGTIYAIEREDWPAWTGRHTPEYTDCAAVVICIDHHSPGDPGYGQAPTQFLHASSIGQVIAELARLGVLPLEQHRRCDYGCEAGDIRYGQPGGWEVVTQGHDGPEGQYYWCASVPHDLVLTAAADHCLGAAYQGECPGVEPDGLMRWRAASRAAYQRRSVEAVLADVEATTAALRDAQPIGLSEDTISVADMRREPPYPELPEAAARAGRGYISGPLIGPDGRRKYTCSGSPEQVRAFMSIWAPDHGIVGIYGDPARGFAGGYAD